MTDTPTYGPENFYDAGLQLRPKPLDPADRETWEALWVDLAKGRSHSNFTKITRTLQQDLRAGSRRSGLYMLFLGHTGCGKSTELRRFAQEMMQDKKHYPVLIDAEENLDFNNLRYPDVLLALATALTRQLEEHGIAIETIHLQNLKDWFLERIGTQIREESFRAEIETSARLQLSLLSLAKLLAKATTAIKDQATYREEIRERFRNNYSAFAARFNDLIIAIEEEIQKKIGARRILFIIDGMEKIHQDDAKKFFVDDVSQIKQILGNFLYAAPIGIQYQSNDLSLNFEPIEIMPMTRLHKPGSPDRIGMAYDILRDMLLRRVHPSLFDDTSTVDYLIEQSGGHPRELLRLAGAAWRHAPGEQILRESADLAVREVGEEFRRFLGPDEYALLASVARNPDRLRGGDETARKLLRANAILEYNGDRHWWAPHPTIRHIPEFREAFAGDGG